MMIDLVLRHYACMPYLPSFAYRTIGPRAEFPACRMPHPLFGSAAIFKKYLSEKMTISTS
jgi:hypothetical protein